MRVMGAYLNMDYCKLVIFKKQGDSKNLWFVLLTVYRNSDRQTFLKEEAITLA